MLFNARKRRRKSPISNGLFYCSSSLGSFVLLVIHIWHCPGNAFVPSFGSSYHPPWFGRSTLQVVEESPEESVPVETTATTRRWPKVKQQRFSQSQYSSSSSIIQPKPSLQKKNDRPPMTSSSNDQSTPQQRDSSKTTHRSPMSQKPSIEALEQRLSQRFGTDMSRWTSGDYDDDDDEEEDDAATSVASIPARPVRDPWQSDTESPNVKETPSKPSVPVTPFKENSSVSLQSSAIASTKSPLAAFGRRPVRDVVPPAVETPRTSRLIPRPVPAPPRQDSPSPQVPAIAKEEPSVARTASSPLLDANGRAMLLTLDQAQSLFQETLDPEETFRSEMDDSSSSSVQSLSWLDLGISDPQLLGNLAEMGCATPLPAQRTAVPRIGSGETDVVVGTYTGSGKTLAVMVPVLQRLLSAPPPPSAAKDSKNFVRLIVCAPGRELASQIASVTRKLTQDTDLSVLLAIGGTTFSRNVEQIRRRKPDILIGTPGRLAELVVGSSGALRGRLSVQQVQALVLDEFDALLSYAPHADPVRALVDALKRSRGMSLQSILCSATAVDMLKQKSWEENFLRPGYVWAMADAADHLVTSGSEAQVNTIRVSRTVMHGVVHVPQKRFALDTLRRILHTEPFPQQILIFVADARKVDICVEKLAQFGILAAPLHGDSAKTDRAEVSQALRDGTVGMVVATEMAARGLDAPLLTHVINMDLPTDAAHYAHRAGRCGRGGRPGIVINLTTSSQERNVPMKFAKHLGIPMYTVEVKNSKLNVVDDAPSPSSDDSLAEA